jgi:hypothetical protein
MLVIGVESVINVFKLGVAESETLYPSLELLGIEPSTNLITLAVAGN